MVDLIPGVGQVALGARILSWAGAHRKGLAIAGVLLAAAVAGGVFVHGRMQPKVDQAQASAETATDNATARGLEAEGEGTTAARAEVLGRQVARAEAATRTLAAEAGAAPDANEPLPADRAARLLAHDVELCRARPSLCPDSADGAAAAAEDAGAGGSGMPALPTAG